jgi:hypothetical protein
MIMREGERRRGGERERVAMGKKKKAKAELEA